MKGFLERLGKERLYCDGGTGSVLQAKGLKGGELPERWNLTRSRYDSSWQSLRSFVAERPDYVMKYIQETFSLSDAEMEEYFGESLRLIESYKALHG